MRVKDKLLNIIKSALKWYMIVLSFWFLVLGFFFVFIIITDQRVPDNGIFDCKNKGSYISGQFMTINTTPNTKIPEIIETFEECLHWHILESEQHE